MEYKFSTKEAVSFAWQTTKQNLAFFIGLMIITFLTYVIPNFLADSLQKHNLFFSFVFSITGAVLGIVVNMGLIKISLNFCDNIKSKIADVFSQYKLFFKLLLALILQGLIVLAGLILLIVPGIYFAVRLQFYRFFIIDKRSGIIESLKRSWVISRGNAWKLFLFTLLLSLINLAGFLFFVIGLFVTVPTTMLAITFVYRKLLSQVENSAISVAANV